MKLRVQLRVDSLPPEQYNQRSFMQVFATERSAIMNRYDRPLASPRRKSHRGLKIFGGILAVLLVAGGIAFALNYNTVLLFFGKGTVNLPAASSMAEALKANSQYEDVQTSSDAAGNTVVTAKSADGAVSIQSTTDSSGQQNIQVQMDVKKMDGVSTSKSLSNLTAIQSKINDYLSSVVDPSQLSGIESYVAREVLAQYQKRQSTFSIANDFGGTKLQAAGNFETGVIDFTVERSAGASK